MRERPILFSGPMVRALLSGAKTQTRRAVRLQRPTATGAQFSAHANGWRWVFQGGAKGSAFHGTTGALGRCPHGTPGDRLWVRETWAWSGDKAVPSEERVARGEVWFRADERYTSPNIRWRPSIHMPRAASRITLELTGVRVERLQDISEADAKAEGAEAMVCGEGDPPDHIRPRSHRTGFVSLWDSLNAGRSRWASNPWVWVLEFKRVAT